MAEFEADMRTFLLAQNALSIIIADRLMPNMLSQDLPSPGIAYQQISEVPDYDHTGDTGYRETRIQFDIEGDSVPQVQEVAAALDSALSGFHGTMGETRMHAVFKQNQISAFNAQNKSFRIIQDYKFAYTIND